MGIDLESELKKCRVWHRFIEKEETVHTADAAKVSGFPLERITKSLVFLDEDKHPLLAVVPGNCKVNKDKFRKVIGCKEVNLVPFETAEQYSGYSPGGTCPLFHLQKMKVIVDEKIVQFETVFNGGGSRNLLVELKTQDIIKLNDAVVADITE